MGVVIDMTGNRVIVRQNEKGWIALIIENRRRVAYQFERRIWAEKFACDRQAEWQASKERRETRREDHGPGTLAGEAQTAPAARDAGPKAAL